MFFYLKSYNVNLFLVKLDYVFFKDKLLSLGHCRLLEWPWGRLSHWQKWVPGEFSGSKCGWCVRLTTLPPSCAVVMKSGNLNFLEPSGPLQDCNGTAFTACLHAYCYLQFIVLELHYTVQSALLTVCLNTVQTKQRLSTFLFLKHPAHSYWRTNCTKLLTFRNVTCKR